MEVVKAYIFCIDHMLERTDLNRTTHFHKNKSCIGCFTELISSFENLLKRD